MTCEAARPAPLRCPTLPERIAATLALLPGGRAWGSDAGVPEPYHDAAFDPAAFDPEVFDTKSKTGSVIYRFFAAVATVFHFVEQRLCDLRLEFFCATMSETRDLWLAEYGLPDDCDPFPDLCDKVAAFGGARCEYFNARIARKGWTAVCFDRLQLCGARAGCSQAGARLAMAGPSSALALVVRVFTNEAPAPVTPATHIRRPLAGIFRAGWAPSCDTAAQPSIEPVRCLMERIAPAHVQIQYLT
jgi:hypothetical protein